MLDWRTIQTVLAKAGFLKTKDIDGVGGPKTRAAGLAALRSLGVGASTWARHRQEFAIGQFALKALGFDPGVIDGLDGPDTKIALERWQNAMRDIVPGPAVNDHLPAAVSAWPRQKDMPAFYGAPGTGHVRMSLPFAMRLAWDLKTEVRSFMIHEKCAASATRVFERVKAEYGEAELRRLNLDRFGGCFANRPMRGGVSLSTHAFACAIDIDPEHNQLRWGRDRAAMARPECAAFVAAFQEEGWISLGAERNYDWMHFQAARF